MKAKKKKKGQYLFTHIINIESIQVCFSGKHDKSQRFHSERWDYSRVTTSQAGLDHFRPKPLANHPEERGM